MAEQNWIQLILLKHLMLLVSHTASAGGITTTGGDFYVGGDLYVLDDIVYDGNWSQSEYHWCGTFAELNVTGNVTLGDSSSDQINLNGRAFGHLFLLMMISLI